MNIQRETYPHGLEQCIPHWAKLDDATRCNILSRVAAWHLAALKKARIIAMTECLGIASRHAAAEFVERDIRERLERLEKLPPIEEVEVRANITDVGRTKPIPFEDPWAKEGEAS